MLRLTLASVLGLLVLMSSRARPVAAQSTPYVAVLDPAYQDLDLLVSAGLVQDIIVGERPYSRAAFRRFVAEATRRVGNHPESPAIREALERLTRRFADQAPASRYVHLAPARFDVVGTNSPYRPITSHSRGDSIKASLNPLLQNNQGRVLDDGLTAAVEGGLDVQIGHLAGEVTPRVYLGVPSGSAGTHLSAQIVDAYARAVFGPVAFDIGRNSVTLGYGVYGGPLLSVNPRGLDMARLSADRPVRLPGALSALGLWQASIAIADMGKNRDVPYAKQIMMRLSARPSRYFELGINYTNMQGGNGSPRATLYERLYDLFFFWKNGGYYQISDKVAGADFRVSVPQIHAAWYVNFATTDDRGRFQQPARGYWNDAIWTTGAKVTNLGPEGRLGLDLEWVRAGPRIYTHHQFTSGQTVDGRVLGNALGPNAWQVLARANWMGRTSRIRVTAAWERYSADEYYWALIPGGGPWDFKWYKAYGAPPEIRRRLVADYTRYDGWHHLETSIRLGYEHVTRFNFTGPNRNDLLGQVTLRYLW